MPAELTVVSIFIGLMTLVAIFVLVSSAAFLIGQLVELIESGQLGEVLYKTSCFVLSLMFILAVSYALGKFIMIMGI